MGVPLEEAWPKWYQYTKGEDESYKQDNMKKKANPMPPEILAFLVDDAHMFISYQASQDALMLGWTFDLPMSQYCIDMTHIQKGDGSMMIMDMAQLVHPEFYWRAWLVDGKPPELSHVCSLLFEGVYDSLRAAMVMNTLHVLQQKNPLVRLLTDQVWEWICTTLDELVDKDDASC